MTRDKTAEQRARKRAAETGESRPRAGRGRERPHPARGQPGAVAMTGQGLGELAADVLVVLDEQDA